VNVLRQVAGASRPESAGCGAVFLLAQRVLPGAPALDPAQGPAVTLVARAGLVRCQDQTIDLTRRLDRLSGLPRRRE